MISKRHVEIACTVKRETDKAVLINDGTRDAWIPKALIDLHPEMGDVVTAVMPEWVAKDKGLI